MSHARLALMGAIILVGALGCGKAVNSALQVEAVYCNRAISYESTVTVQGQARYQRRTLATGAPGGLGAVDSTTKPIRYAEVAVLTEGDGLVQCGETDGSGYFSLSVPRGERRLRLVVRSRANNSQLRASVLNNPTDNFPYSIEASFVPSQRTLTSLSLLAPATGTLEGGAFNILDQFLRANEYLALNGLCSGVCTSTFTTPPKVSAYWTAGFNPNRYLGNSSPLLSFYVRGQRQIYILGGNLGDVNSTDTDHFDDSVIIHEYGHFIEDVSSISNSPGGTHQGTDPIDPRLAWSEAWANYFSASVLKTALYQDTQGNSQGSPGSPVVILENLESGTRDTPTVGATGVGEGNFREFAISRFLWDAIDSAASTSYVDTDGDAVTAGSFNELWQIFSGPFASSVRRFRNFGLFTQLQAAQGSATNLSSLLTTHQQKATQADYATPDSGDACGATTIVASRLAGDTGTSTTFSKSNQFASNDFYSYEHGGGSLTVTLTTASGPADLDLYVYRDGYTYGSSSSLIGSSDNFRCLAGQTTETVTTTASAGTIMLNVKVYSATVLPASCGGGANDISSSTYNLTVNGNKICP
jgi:hypothetical protein